MEKNYIKIGVEVLVKKNGKILFGKRLAKAGFHEWGLPGGHLEYGESLEGGAKRELWEETGLTADKLEFVNITNDPRPDGHYIHLAFAFEADGLSQEPQVMEPDKCEKWEWFSPEKLPEPLFFGHKKLLLAVLKKHLLSD
jgi:8-oxo-dGTP diphosphatase